MASTLARWALACALTGSFTTLACTGSTGGGYPQGDGGVGLPFGHGSSGGSGGSSGGSSGGRSGGSSGIGSSGSSSGGGSTGCGLTTGNQACDGCLQTSCCAPETACAQNAQCVPLLQCLTQCQGNAQCEQGCSQQYPNGGAALSPFFDCASQSCASQCGISGGGSSSGGGNGSSSGSGGGGGGCGLDTGNQVCDACLQAGCCAQEMACAQNAQCTPLINCVLQCQGNQSCQQQCAQQYPNGTGTAQALIDCASQSCPGKC